MAKFNFVEFARRLSAEGGLQSMQPVIEKEIIHYEILNQLDKIGALSQMAFQGGTCLRLCYGGVRFSEDLDFAAGARFDDIEIEELTLRLKEALERRFDVNVRAGKHMGDVRQRPERVRVERRWIIVDTVPERPDIPSQRIKVEIASVPHHTRMVRRLALNYRDLPASYGMVLVVCESPEEILADKIVSFADAEYVRYRDLWDIPWLIARPGIDRQLVSELVHRKHEDYACAESLDDMLSEGNVRAAREIRSETFAKEMERFIPYDVFERTVGRPGYLEVMALDLEEAYEIARR